MSLDLAKVIAVARGLTARFDMAVDEYTPFYPNVCTVRQSAGFDEDYGWIGAMPQMREWAGDRIFKDLRGSTYIVENRDYETSILIPRNAIEDDRYGIYGDVVAGLADEATKFPDELLITDIEAAGTIPVADGQYFYDTDHAWGDSGTQSNDITYDVTTTTAPTALEFKAAFEASVVQMLGFKNDQGKKFFRGIVNRIGGFAVGVPTNMRGAAYAAFESVIISNSSNVVIDRPDIYCLPELTSTAKFHTWYKGGRIKPFLMQDRRPLMRFVKGIEDREFKDLKFMVDRRLRMRPLFWPYAVRTTLV